MVEFFQALKDPDLVFLRYALILSLVASVPLGAVGTLVVARRISYLAAAIAHSALGGIGVALYLREAMDWLWLSPMLGALLSAMLSAALVGWVSLCAREREDAAIGAIWVSGMAIGLLSIYHTTGYVDPMGYLFGDILLVQAADLQLAGVVGLIITATLLLAYRPVMAVCFDAEFAAIRGVRSRWVYLLLLQMTALSVVLLVSLVGIVLVIALLTLPPAIASMWARSLWQMVLGSIFLSAGFLVAGLVLSFSWDVPTGPVVILLAVSVYLACLAMGRFSSRG
ncbi:MAG: metal ABC transporter permease [Verrucomicrobia bacterium]|nr:metal ABC transporter permease [Verrucomicrobiota bacterium]